ncbi:hypothetical protein H6G20_17255 [Desertifilum sp. FACHB-1129]|uniref:Uncharacterized protein n=3 Tax=Cyanophyceae TaxID=3028117 RepID=A0A1E5QJM4_9CYAN|nr:MULTISPECIES: hypothetical protein [Cyanophyceae]MCD8486868.1 hypothetical protein [Desertifilum sp.]MDA0210978.1 hypothetical protein [Cyanobacteria bacterium FC1]MDK3159016.1 hypothetical protein [Kamptonema cortianum]MBD2313419.1 hypothetical protein [Desertifilum sp. FACHB-1129]MBD2322289.1 hypothetical protein [Desertifilum sp. FACHB-866]
MARLLPVKSSTALHAIAFTVAVALIAGQHKSKPIQFSQTGPQQPTIVQVQIESEVPVALRPSTSVTR